MHTIAQLAKLYGRSERTVFLWKSQGLPIQDPEAMADIISEKRSRRGVSKFAHKTPVVVEEEPCDQTDDLIAQLDQAEVALVHVHFILAAVCHAVRSGKECDVCERLGGALDHTRPFVEALTKTAFKAAH